MPILPLTLGCKVVAEAIHPTSGNVVSGVTVSAFTFYGIDSGPGNSGTPNLATVLPQLVPDVSAA